MQIGIQVANQFFINSATYFATLAMFAAGSVLPFPAVYFAALTGIPEAQLLRGTNTQAAEQKLVIHHSTLNNGRPALPRRIFAAELEELGYPSEGIRNVAIANGSGEGRVRPDYRPFIENDEGDLVRGPVVERPVRGLLWRSGELTAERPKPASRSAD